MGVTYTSVHQRDDRLATGAARRLDRTDAVLLATTVAAVLAIALTYGGVRRRVINADGARPVVDVHAISDARQLEPVLDALGGTVDDRRLAARELFRFLDARRRSGIRAANVAVVLDATVEASTIDATPAAAAYADRLRQAREHANHAGRAPPEALPLLTPADLAAIKPSLIVRTPEAFARQLAAWSTAYVLAFYALVLVWRLRGVAADRLLLAAAHLLTAVGLAALVSRADPLRDTLLFVRYTSGVLIGLGLMGAASLVDLRRAAFSRVSYVPLVAALSFCVLLLLLGDGPGSSRARVNLGPVQPIEGIRLLLGVFLAGYFARRWELLRQVPRAEYVLPIAAGVAASLLLFFLQKDLGPALLLSCVFVILYAVASGRAWVAAGGFLLLAAGFYIGAQLELSETLAARLQMWRMPWENGVRGGDQTAHGLWALATGGLAGTGLGLGDTRYLPAGHTDLVLAAIGEEAGLIGLLIVGAAYSVITWRGLRAALRASSEYGFYLATSVTLFLVVPALVMGASILGLIPLTGVVTPFLSYGGSAMATNFAALGILAAVTRSAGVPSTVQPFRRPVTYLAGALAACAAVIVGALVSTQVVYADEYAVKPHFGVQADGVRRYQYNPRVLDVIRALPRGSVFDRAGRVLATGDPAIAARAREEYRELGITADPTCTGAIVRCYPLGGLAFHLLGDAATRVNWSASNTSYVERDAADRLRGFRDYREAIPLLRHRYDLEHRSVQQLLDRNRDLRLTIDARLQVQIATILATHAGRASATGRAAAVVLDADTGDVLALVSHPLPRPPGTGDRAPRLEEDALVDRARYGLYAPGSIFKLVTATAALRRDPAASSTTFACRHLPDGRVGARLRAGGVVRDDVRDRRPHGTISMRDGIVHSCNAYFAQLALHIGPEALLETADTLGVSVAPARALPRLRATLPQAAYGQGDVVVTPLRMARLAAALATDGRLRQARWEAGLEESTGDPVLLPPDAARLLARAMRDAVVSGTGRTLRDHPWRIAGKTGTAEVAGAPSHAWFVGFAPYGAAKARVAFAVLIENAGYGGSAAAPVAGEIVTAAAALGLVK